jgi:lipopolysaccharide/colanic/teichoic acid biosynthesis glycosyltransferase
MKRLHDEFLQKYPEQIAMNQRKLSSGILISDLLWSTLAMAGALVLRYGTKLGHLEVASVSALLPLLAATWVTWTFLFRLLSLDGFGGGWRFSAVVSQLLLSVGGLMLLLLSCGYLLRKYVSRLALVHFGWLLFAGFVLIRVAAYLLLRARSNNGGASRVVIVGRGRLVRELERKIRSHPEMICKVVGILAPDDGTFDSGSLLASASPVVSTGALGVVELLREQRIDELILALQEGASRDLLNLTALCRDRGIKVSLVPQLYELYLSRSHLVDLGGLPVLQTARPGLTVATQVWKRALDLFLGALLSVVAFPLLLPLAVVLHHIKGKAFRWEKRCGFRGKPFRMLRLNIDRTASNASRFERILRVLSLTELPQLWNVLRGDMSMVGPRPEPPNRVCRYSEWQQQRLTVKPGMTGLAQVEGLREQHSSEEKTRFDLQYLLNLSLWTDLSLLLQTIGTLATRSAKREGSLAGVEPTLTANDPIQPNIHREILENAHRP